MRFKDVFSIIGPGMIGPSSSHTAGAVRIGRAARHLFGGMPLQAELTLYGSFAETYEGHGTDLALAAGLLDYATDDERIRNALSLAKALGMELTFNAARDPTVHPNSVLLTLRSENREDSFMGASIGGGNAEMTKINGFDVKFSVHNPTLLVFHADRLGMLAAFTSLIEAEWLNISYMDVNRKSRAGDALTVIQTDERLSGKLPDRIRAIEGVRRVASMNLS
ncbi:L-serine ammonia-lyase, iron-sulfur-dependent subunit beta [Paenibacillus sp. N4]|uniref:L-serine ammonia-lyase, iron-sulfur-dependent subunit beta n=1 Tax=Paenibacillus vietnamensis TaxID=2590547 RepID=UPI001CD0C762|nr:L-serine ammonia-lyase, iron-sulfur-dependent subunit beta [Paenibacillus vietnamensis]MCA0754277.1 L-serine ammonia-lyase, iron-sulfur-dependent subunit beta [Paenibacillus vietnamensis]